MPNGAARGAREIAYPSGNDWIREYYSIYLRKKQEETRKMGKSFTLYEIDSAIADLIDGETGEIVDIERFEALQLDRSEKVKNIALSYKNLCAEADALKTQEKAFAERRKSAEARAENCKRYLEYALHGGEYKSTEVCVRYRKSTAVTVDDGAQIPDIYLRYKDPEINREELKKALKAGEVIEGVRLEEKRNMQIV